MNCPVCKAAALQPGYLEPQLSAHLCASCGGAWIHASDYHKWLEQQGPEQAPSSADVSYAVADTRSAKLCPACGHILIRYKVAEDLAFGLDHCGNCNGFWLDRMEWEHLRQHQLHGQVHRVFTAPWQRQLRQREHAAAVERMLQERLGDVDYAELKRVKAWLDRNPNRPMLLAYLQAPEETRR